MIGGRLLLCLVAAGSLFAACGGDGDDANGDASSGCSPAQAQAIDPSSSQHVLPGAPAPVYITDPPTSGAHAPGNHATGVLTTSLDKPVQVALLEAGHVLLQYRNLSSAERRIVERMASSRDDVTVAPNDALPAPIVATAWLHVMRCQRADPSALEEFIASHAGKHEGH